MSFIVSIHTEFEEHIFCPTGDLWLEIGAHKVHCLVSSSAMAAASPVFRAMLFSGFAESKPAEGRKWLVRLPDDDIVGFYPLLSIAHGDWEEVPTGFKELEGYDPCPLDYIKDTLQFVYQVVKLADKYDCTRLLRTVAPWWCRAISRATMYPNAGHEIDGSSVAILWTGWVFGDKGMIEAELRRVYLGAHVVDYADDDPTVPDDDTTPVGDESQGGLMIRDEETDFLPLWTPGLFRSSSITDACQILNLLDISVQLKTLRRHVLSKVFRQVKTFLNTRFAGPCCESSYEGCSWYRTISERLLDHLFGSDNCKLSHSHISTDSIKGVLDELRAFRTFVMGDATSEKLPVCTYHLQCLNHMVSEVIWIYESAPIPSLGKAQGDHLESQRVELTKDCNA